MFDEEFLKNMPKDISRRDMLKLSALVGGSALFNPLSAAQEEPPKGPKHNTKAKIVIVGGGDAGITISARLNNLLENPDITIIDPNVTHYYQPGQTLVGSGVWNLDDISFALKDFVPSGVKLIEDSAKALDPDNNQITISSGEVITYDYMVLATGLELNYQAIKGLKREDLGTNGLASIYAPEGAAKTFSQIQEVAKKGKNQKIQTLFTHPKTPIKCGGAPKKIMNLTEHYLRTEKARDKAEINFMTPGGKYFGLDPYEDAVKKQFHKRGQVAKFHHELIEVDVKSKIATFRHEYEVQGEYDEDFEEYDMITKVKNVSLEYDFLHVTPPMKAHDVVKNSPLAWQKGSSGKFGLIEVDQHTLQHKRYPNVFGAGDVIGTKYGKTGGSVRKQAPVVAENLVAVIKGKEAIHKYDGYTVCPLITSYGSVMLAEFNYEGAAPSFPMDPSEQRWLWWLLKVYALKPMYFHGMLRGRM
jgi:sulfide:quinone oxidoreductase